MRVKQMYVFVYGTLRMDERNHNLLASAKKIAEQAWTLGRLYDTGQGYPGLIRHKKERVYGELYKVTKSTLTKLDELEGYVKGSSHNLYERERRKVYTDHGEVYAYVYRYLGQVAEESYIPYGDWKVYQLMKENKLLYFAYGSCMDDQRFRLAGVEAYFQHVLGCGRLEGYQLRYTKIAKEGGRADIVESKKKHVVQGKVYQLSKDALPYLYKREGVDARIYRPAVIRIQLHDQLIPNVLTFIVVNKRKEAAPPYEYVQEILRGGYGTLTEQYLIQQINYLKIKHRFNVKKLKRNLTNDQMRMKK